MTVEAFLDSIPNAKPPSNSSNLLHSLWYDRKGDWHKAHDLVDGTAGKEAAWIHAYLHRKEGDTWNADYWYGRAGHSRPDISLEEEWLQLLRFFLKQ